MGRVDSISVRGFRSIGSVENLQLRPINVLIGSNGSGKSNFVEVFSFLQETRSGHLQSYVIRAGGADSILHFGSKRTDKLDIRISFETDTEGLFNQYEMTLAPTSSDGLYPALEYVYIWDKNKRSQPLGCRISGNGLEAAISNIAGIQGARAEVVGRYVGRYLEQWRLYHFHDTSANSPMKKTADLNDNRFLRPDGSNLPAFLYYLNQKHESSYRMIRNAVRLVAPFFDDFQLLPQALNEDKIRLEWKHIGSEDYFDVSSLSDGTLRFIALTTLLLQPPRLRPSMILLDEPELGLHPLAITLLASLARQASVDTQVLLATQSPILLDHFEPEDVLVTERVNGGTEIARLNPEELRVWLEDYSLGQLWEKNELGGRPYNSLTIDTPRQPFLATARKDIRNLNDAACRLALKRPY